MKVALAPPDPGLTRRLEASGHVVRPVPRARLASLREGDVQVFLVADMGGRITGITERLAGVIRLLRSVEERVPHTPRLLVTEHLTSRMATAAGEAGAFVTTVIAAPATLAAIEGQLLRDSRPPVPTSRLRAEMLVPGLHDPGGPLDAAKVAAALGVAVSALAKAVGVTPSALSRRTTAPAAQRGLREIEFVWSVLCRELGSAEKARAWLHAPHPDLGGEPPMSLLAKGSATALADYVRSALAGQPT